MDDFLRHACVSKAAVACVGFRSKLKALVNFIFKYAQVQKNRLNEKILHVRLFYIFSFRMDFFIFFPIFENLSSAGSKNRKLNCSGLTV